MANLESDFGINRRGQRIRCVLTMTMISDNGGASHPGPIAGTEYTVDSFAPFKAAQGEYPGLTLIEIESAKCACCGDLLAWPCFAFRPIVAGGTDISALEGIAREQTDSVKQPEPV